MAIRIDPNDETLICAEAAAKLIGKSRLTVGHYFNHGFTVGSCHRKRTVKLWHVRLGRTPYTSQKALAEFSERLAATRAALERPDPFDAEEPIQPEQEPVERVSREVRRVD